MIGGKKIVGILTEMGMKKSRPDYVIIGVGINCNQTTFSGGLEQKATSLKKEYGHDVCREKVIARFLNEFEELYEGFVQYGSLAFVKQAYEKLLVNRGERVRVLEPGREWTGRALGITDTGELIVEAEDGEIREVGSGPLLYKIFGASKRCENCEQVPGKYLFVASTAMCRWREYDKVRHLIIENRIWGEEQDVRR